MLKRFGFIRVGASVPELRVANVEFNTKEIIKEIKILESKGVQILTFPELCLTGYTCGDLFSQEILLEKSLCGLKDIMNATKELNIVVIVGMPIVCDNQLFNCGVVVSRGEILGIVPKTYIPNYGEFYEKRWFSSSKNLVSNSINLFGKEIPIGVDLLFRDVLDKKIVFG